MDTTVRTQRPSADCSRCLRDPLGYGDRIRYVCTARCGKGQAGAFADTTEHPKEDAFHLVKDDGPKPYHGLLPPKQTQDAVNLPHHYARFAIEPVTFCVENNLNFLQANTVKYTLRHDAKNGKEDLKKAIRNLVMLIKREYNKDAKWSGPDEGLAAYLKTI